MVRKMGMSSISSLALATHHFRNRKNVVLLAPAALLLPPTFMATAHAFSSTALRERAAVAEALAAATSACASCSCADSTADWAARASRSACAAWRTVWSCKSGMEKKKEVGERQA